MIDTASIMPLMKKDLFASLPPPWSEDPLPAIREALIASQRKIVVLDDDPTGTQTVYDTPVLTEWSIEALARELKSEYQVFYILTNSRSLPPEEAIKLNSEIARNLRQAAKESNRAFVVVSRSDSTLRGHFPEETDALVKTLQLESTTLLLVPFFEAGGRITIENEHYLVQGDTLVPASQTPFARDATFGYKNSNLCKWVEEKTNGRIPAESVTSISLEELRMGGPEIVYERLLEMKGTPVCVVNAVNQRDLEVLVQGLLAAEQAGRSFIYRSAASFVAARSGMAPRELLKSSDLSLPAKGPELIIFGSHVPQSSEQLQRLLCTVDNLEKIEVEVSQLLDEPTRSNEIARVKLQVDQSLHAGKRTLVHTSRSVVQGSDPAESLDISRNVSDALVTITQSVSIRPRYIIAKGGITSSDIATRGLGVKRALVRGQILPGVPVWELGSETRFPGLTYVVFPGNVGGPNAIVETVRKLENASHQFLDALEDQSKNNR